MIMPQWQIIPEIKSLIKIIKFKKYCLYEELGLTWITFVLNKNY
jgi:hypothetical protein